LYIDDNQINESLDKVDEDMYYFGGLKNGLYEGRGMLVKGT
jgi:hypothetical protein